MDNYEDFFKSKPAKVKIEKYKNANLDNIYNNNLADYIYKCPNCDNILKIMMKDGCIVSLHPCMDKCPSCGQLIDYFEIL